MRSSFSQAAQYSHARQEALAQWTGPVGEDFSWVTPPVLNPFTRVAVETCAARGLLRVIGYEREQAGAPAVAVTAIGEIAFGVAA